MSKRAQHRHVKSSGRSSSRNPQPGRVAVTPPDPTVALTRRLELACRGRQHDEAIDILHALLARKPQQFAYLNLLGELCLKTRRFGEAINAFSQALQLQPQHPDVFIGLGQALHEFRQYEGAAAAFEMVTLWHPAHHRAMGYRALALAELNRFDQALELLTRAIELTGNEPFYFLSRGQLLNRINRHEQALQDFASAVSLEPEEALYRLGHAAQWHRLRNHEAALQAVESLVRAGKADSVALNFHGVLLSEMGRNDEARTAYERALAMKPDNADAQFNLSLLLLTLGDFKAGWPMYESRWRRTAAPPAPVFNAPLWLGFQDLSESTLLVYGEQGLGDMLQFARYVPLVARRAAQVLFVIPKTLAPLFGWMPVNVTVLEEGASIAHYDYRCPLMSLPMVFKTTPQTVPPQQFELTVPKARQFAGLEDWLASDNLKVGVCWSGNAAHTNDHNRSLSFDEFSAVLDDLQQAVCLQKEIRDSDAQAVAACSKLAVVSEHLTDMSATAALISQLDLVITVDTSVAHLAAALGKPTWVLVAKRADFRWMLDTEDSPWYPSVSLLRQRTAGDWSDVLREVRSRLACIELRNQQVDDIAGAASVALASPMSRITD